MTPTLPSMKTFATVLTLCLATLAFQAQAQGTTCHAATAEKRLSGAAKASFLKKCEKDAKAACEATAADRKLYGAARASFTAKCFREAVGTAN
ncbi:hypothetical protein [Hydrogenophaga aquatica]